MKYEGRERKNGREGEKDQNQCILQDSNLSYKNLQVFRIFPNPQSIDKTKISTKIPRLKLINPQNLK